MAEPGARYGCLSYTDPFGLTPCDPPDSPECRRERVEGPITSTDPGFADPTILVGGLAAAGRAAIGAMLARRAAAASERVLFEGTKDALREVLEAGMRGLSKGQTSSIRRSLGEGSADLIRVVTGENGVVTYATRAGRNGYQTLVRMYDASGRLKGMAQAAWDAAGRFVHGEIWR